MPDFYPFLLWSSSISSTGNLPGFTCKMWLFYYLYIVENTAAALFINRRNCGCSITYKQKKIRLLHYLCIEENVTVPLRIYRRNMVVPLHRYKRNMAASLNMYRRNMATPLHKYRRHVVVPLHMSGSNCGPCKLFLCHWVDHMFPIHTKSFKRIFNATELT